MSKKTFIPIQGLKDQLLALQQSLVRHFNNLNLDIYDKIVYYDFTDDDIVAGVLTITHNRPGLQFVQIQFGTLFDHWSILTSTSSTLQIAFIAGTESGRVKMEW